jgi:hypothetical protein
MSDIYLNVTVYRGGTLDEPTLPLVIDDVFKLRLNSLIGIASHFEVESINFDEEYTELVREGDIISITIGTSEDNNEEVRGRVFNVSYPEDEIKIIGQDWTYFLIGPRVTRRYGDEDYASILRSLITAYAPNIKTNFLLDIGYTTGGRYSGAYQDLLYIVNELVNRPSYDWKIRTDREFVMFPDGWHIDFIDGFNEETDGSDPDGWTEVSGTWSVLSNRYIGTHTSHFISNSTATTKDDIDIRLIGHIDSTGTGDALLVIFDYVSASDFKYLELDASADTWILGHYDGVFNTDDTSSNTVDEDVDTRIRIVIDGNIVSAYEWDSTNQIWTLVVDFTYASVGTGLIGAGGRANAAIEVNDFVVYSAANITLDEDDFISHDIAKRDFRDLINRQTVVGGYARLNDQFERTLYQWSTIYNEAQGTVAIVNNKLDIQETGVGSNEIRIWSNDTYNNQIIEATVTIKNDGDTDNCIILYRSADDNNYYKVKFDADANTVELFYNTGSGDTNITSVSQTIANETEYVFKIKVFGENHKVYVDDTLIIDTGDSNITGGGKSGIGVESSHIEVETFDLQSDRVVVASAQDASLMSTWGTKVGEPIRDSDIVTRAQALARAQYELDLQRFLKTRGIVKDEGRVDIQIGDVTNLLSPSSGISNVNYRIFGVEHLFDPEDEGGWVTFYSVAEDLPRIEDVIRRIVLTQASIVYGTTLTQELDLLETQTLDGLYYYEAIYKNPYYMFEVDYLYIDFWSVY